MKNKSILALSARIIEMYLKYRVSRASAALAYFLMLSFFPMLICLYEMLGSLFPKPEEIIALVSGIIPQKTVETILEYIGYISLNSSKAMLWGAIIAMATSSAAAYRTIQGMIGEIIGVSRFTGAFSLVFSFIFSLLFLASVYFAIVVMITGTWFVRSIDKYIKFLNISQSWTWARFVLLFCLLLVIIYGIYKLTVPKCSNTNIVHGAAFASVTRVIVSIVFSSFIGMSARYPLVYGSLASVIILLLWLYVCGNVIFIGSIINKIASDNFNRNLR